MEFCCRLELVVKLDNLLFALDNLLFALVAYDYGPCL